MEVVRNFYGSFLGHLESDACERVARPGKTVNHNRGAPANNFVAMFMPGEADVGGKGCQQAADTIPESCDEPPAPTR